MRYAALALTSLFLLGACSTPTRSAGVQATPSATSAASPAPTGSAAPSPYADITPGQQAVDAQVLPPATVAPQVRLCAVMYGFVTAESIYGPAFCIDGSLNEAAWMYFRSVSPHLMAAGPAATVDQVDNAMRADRDQHASDAQEYWAYALAHAYYGWTFTPSPACVYLYHQSTCNLSPPAYSAAQAAVAARSLPPATVQPVARLCSADVTATADGNWSPLFCGASINVVAWHEYTGMGPNIMAAGRQPSVGQVNAALRADSAKGGLTAVEQLDTYQLAAAYYRWTFAPNPACEFLYKTATCY